MSSLWHWPGGDARHEREEVMNEGMRSSVAGAAGRAGVADGLCPGKKLSFGCMRLPVVGEGHARIDLAEFERMADEFLDRGFTYFDTAWMYHEQASERAVGEAVVARHARDSFTLTTKMPLSMLSDADERGQVDLFEEQLRRPRTDHVDYYLAHNVNTSGWTGRAPRSRAAGATTCRRRTASPSW